MKTLAKYVFILMGFVLFYIIVSSKINSNPSDMLTTWFWLFIMQLGYCLGIAILTIEDFSLIKNFINSNKRDIMVTLFSGLLSSFVMSIQVKFNAGAISIIICAIILWGIIILAFGSQDFKSYFFKFKR